MVGIRISIVLMAERGGCSRGNAVLREEKCDGVGGWMDDGICGWKNGTQFDCVIRVRVINREQV